MLTGPEAGITRDSISTEWRWRGEDRDWPIKLFDTAGMSKKSKVQAKLEKLSVADALARDPVRGSRRAAVSTRNPV